MSPKDRVARDKALCGQTIDIEKHLSEMRVATTCGIELANHDRRIAGDPELTAALEGIAQEQYCDEGHIASTLLPNYYPGVYELRRWDYAPGTRQSKHVHDCAKAIYVMEGSIDVLLNDEWKHFERGRVFNVQQGLEHASSSKTGAVLIVLIIEGTLEHGKGLPCQQGT